MCVINKLSEPPIRLSAEILEALCEAVLSCCTSLYEEVLSLRTKILSKPTPARVRSFGPATDDSTSAVLRHAKWIKNLLVQPVPDLRPRRYSREDIVEVASHLMNDSLDPWVTADRNLEEVVDYEEGVMRDALQDIEEYISKQVSIKSFGAVNQKTDNPLFGGRIDEITNLMSFRKFTGKQRIISPVIRGNISELPTVPLRDQNHFTWLRNVLYNCRPAAEYKTGADGCVSTTRLETKLDKLETRILNLDLPELSVDDDIRHIALFPWEHVPPRKKAKVTKHNSRVVRVDVPVRESCDNILSTILNYRVSSFSQATKGFAKTDVIYYLMDLLRLKTFGLININQEQPYADVRIAPSAP